MENNVNNIFVQRTIKNMLEEDKHLSEFCSIDDFDDAIVTLFEELEAFEEATLDVKTEELDSPEGLKAILVTLMNSSWNLIHKYRNLMRSHDKSRENCCRIGSDNTGLNNQIKRLRETIKKRESTICEVQERERQSKVKISNLTRQLKRESEENLKLKKQLQSKEIQHNHELRRVQESGNKLQEQLRKTVGTYVPRSKVTQNYQAEQDKKIRLYQQTINRLEENNSLMMQEINDLKDALSLHAGGLELHVESSGSWEDTPI